MFDSYTENINNYNFTDAERLAYINKLKLDGKIDKFKIKEIVIGDMSIDFGDYIKYNGKVYEVLLVWHRLEDRGVGTLDYAKVTLYERSEKLDDSMIKLEIND